MDGLYGTLRDARREPKKGVHTPRREQVQVRARDGRDGAMDAVGEGARPCAVFFVAGLTAWVRARSKILRCCGAAADAIAKYELGPPSSRLEAHVPTDTADSAGS